MPECTFVFAPDGAGGEVRGDEDVDGGLHGRRGEEEAREGKKESESTLIVDLFVSLERIASVSSQRRRRSRLNHRLRRKGLQ